MLEDHDVGHFLRQMSHVVGNLPGVYRGEGLNEILNNEDEEEMEVVIAVPVIQEEEDELQENLPDAEVQALPLAPVAHQPDDVLQDEHQYPYIVGEVVVEDNTNNQQD